MGKRLRIAGAGIALGLAAAWGLDALGDRAEEQRTKTHNAAVDLDTWLNANGASVQIGKLANDQCIKVGLPTRPLDEWHQRALSPGAGHEGPDADDLYPHDGGPRADVRDPRLGHQNRVRLGVGGAGLAATIEVQVCGVGNTDSAVVKFSPNVPDTAVLIIGPQAPPAPPSSPAR